MPNSIPSPAVALVLNLMDSWKRKKRDRDGRQQWGGGPCPLCGHRLIVTQGDDECALLWCVSRCDYIEIMEAWGFGKRHLFDDAAPYGFAELRQRKHEHPNKRGWLRESMKLFLEIHLQEPTPMLDVLDMATEWDPRATARTLRNAYRDLDGKPRKVGFNPSVWVWDPVETDRAQMWRNHATSAKGKGRFPFESQRVENTPRKPLQDAGSCEGERSFPLRENGGGGVDPQEAQRDAGSCEGETKPPLRIRELTAKEEVRVRELGGVEGKGDGWEVEVGGGEMEDRDGGRESEKSGVETWPDSDPMPDPDENYEAFERWAIQHEDDPLPERWRRLLEPDSAAIALVAAS